MKQRSLRSKINQFVIESGYCSKMDTWFDVEEIHWDLVECTLGPKSNGQGKANAARTITGPRCHVTLKKRFGFRIIGNRHWSTVWKGPNRSLMEGYQDRLRKGRNPVGLTSCQMCYGITDLQSNKANGGITPFSLTYGSKAVIPAEIGIPSYRTLMIREEYNEEEQRLNLD
ncbi:hypothetical protein Tco_1393310 [Tanacetum coccineum]